MTEHKRWNVAVCGNSSSGRIFAHLLNFLLSMCNLIKRLSKTDLSRSELRYPVN